MVKITDGPGKGSGSTSSPLLRRAAVHRPQTAATRSDRERRVTGADDPYDKLRRALRGESNDEAWATVNSTVSRPFPRTKTGKVALKVINHHGDEVMKVIPLPGDHSSSRPAAVQA